MEKVYLHLNKIKLHDTIKKIIFKNKKIKKITKKQQFYLDNIPIINVDITNNKKIILNDKEKQLNNNIENNNINSKNDNIKNDTNNKLDYILKPCITNIIKGIFELISELVKVKLTLKSYSNVANQYIKYNKIDPTIKRICKTPFKKWYIKGYIKVIMLH